MNNFWEIHGKNHTIEFGKRHRMEEISMPWLAIFVHRLVKVARYSFQKIKL